MDTPSKKVMKNESISKLPFVLNTLCFYGPPTWHSGKESLPLNIVVKNLSANAGDAQDVGSIPESGGSPGEGNGKALQYSCLEKSHGQRTFMGYKSMGSQRVGHNAHILCFYI